MGSAQIIWNLWKEAMHPNQTTFRFPMYPLIALLVLAMAGAASAQSVWQPQTPFPAPPAEFLGAAASGKLYLFGGLAPKFVPRGLVYEYDPATKVWTAKKPMPLPSHHLALAEYNGKIYSFGGFKLPASGEIAWEPIDNS